MVRKIFSVMFLGIYFNFMLQLGELFSCQEVGDARISSAVHFPNYQLVGCNINAAKSRAHG